MTDENHKRPSGPNRNRSQGSGGPGGRGGRPGNPGGRFGRRPGGRPDLRGAPRGGGNPDAGRFEATCDACGASARVPFKPEPGRDVFCKPCLDQRVTKKSLQDKYGGRKPRRDPAKGKAIPRLDHGTRVAKPIVCDRCGAKEILAYNPSRAAEVLCSVCLRQEKGQSWRDVRRKAEEEAPLPQTGRRRRRVLEIEKPDAQRLEGFSRVNRQVKIRKSDAPPKVAQAPEVAPEEAAPGGPQQPAGDQPES